MLVALFLLLAFLSSNEALLDCAAGFSIVLQVYLCCYNCSEMTYCWW